MFGVPEIAQLCFCEVRKVLRGERWDVIEIEIEVEKIDR